VHISAKQSVHRQTDRRTHGHTDKSNFIISSNSLRSIGGDNYRPLTVIMNSAVVEPTTLSALSTYVPEWSALACVTVSLLDVGVTSIVNWAVGVRGWPLWVQLVVGVGTPVTVVSMMNFCPALSVSGDFSWSECLIVGETDITHHIQHSYMFSCFYARKQLLLSARLSHRNSVCPSVRLSVCLFVRLSHEWISQKRC